jgi:alkylhydroperoxidase family enzyme
MRIRGLERKETSWLIRWMYGMMKRRFGKVLTPYTVWAYRPATTLTLSVFMQTADASKVVEPSLKSLVSLRAAQLIGCPF